MMSALQNHEDTVPFCAILSELGALCEWAEKPPMISPQETDEATEDLT